MSRQISPERLEELKQRFSLRTPPQKATAEEWAEAIRRQREATVELLLSLERYEEREGERRAG